MSGGGGEVKIFSGRVKFKLFLEELRFFGRE